jgi:hypothetical protein
LALDPYDVEGTHTRSVRHRGSFLFFLFYHFLLSFSFSNFLERLRGILMVLPALGEGLQPPRPSAGSAAAYLSIEVFA